MPTLHTVSLSDCASITDDGIALLLKNSPNIQILNISRCSKLTGKSMESLSEVSDTPD